LLQNFDKNRELNYFRDKNTFKLKLWKSSRATKNGSEGLNGLYAIKIGDGSNR
jgi:hypothetical protein